MLKFIRFSSVFILLGLVSTTMLNNAKIGLVAPTKVTTVKQQASQPNRKTMYGHYAYEEANQADLISVNKQQRLHKDAAVAFHRMAIAAGKKGITLRVQSGFRSKETQHYLFYGIAAQRGHSLEKRARVVAPPGYSEHATGYALDIVGNEGVILHASFAQTKTSKWLEKYAPTFGFELSFPKGNPQGINYEPWHWRYVGSKHSRLLFHSK